MRITTVDTGKSKMLNWLSRTPVCPVSIDEKAWIEKRFAWLIAEFGMERLKESTFVLPTTDYFPASYRCTDEEIVELMRIVADYMQVPFESLELHIYQDDRPQFDGMINELTAGLYTESEGRFGIWIEVATLNDPLATVSTIAHEIGHVLLLGEKRISVDEPDHEDLTDLLTVFMGLGVVTANSVIHEHHWTAGQFSGWSVGKRGYLTMNMYGYALAIYLLLRAENGKTYLSHMRPDVRGACQKGMHYIQKTGDCSLQFHAQ
jgi:hypothetical protein